MRYPFNQSSQAARQKSRKEKKKNRSIRLADHLLSFYINQLTKSSLHALFMSSAKETGADEPRSHCARANNTELMNRLSSVPATGEARTYCRPFVVNPSKKTKKQQQKKTPGPQTFILSLSCSSVWIIYCTVYIEHMPSPYGQPRAKKSQSPP